jgi:APA family basic amino acid/polyamine antiporter
MQQKRTSLDKVMSGMDLFGLAFGAMIGWGWVVLAGDWLRLGGVLGTVVAFAVGALMCILVSIVYAELTSAMPVAGGPFVFVYRGLGENFGWLAGWTTIVAYISVAAWESVAIVAAIDYVIPMPKLVYLWTVAGENVYLSWSLIGVFISLGIVFLNCRGTRLSTHAQNLGTKLLLIAGLGFLLTSAFKGTVSNIEPVWVSGAGTSAVIMMVPFMMVGFDVIPQSAEEAKVSPKIIGILLVISVVAASLWYILISLGLGFAIPETLRNSSRLSVCVAMEAMLGHPLWGKLVALGGICGILTSWNAFFLAASRVLFSMGRAGMLPPWLAHVDPDTGTPIRAIILVGVMCAMAPFLGSNALTWLANVGGLSTCITYLMVSMTLVRLRFTEPEMDRPFRAGRSICLGVLAVLTTGWFVSLYLPIGSSSLCWPYEWAVVLVLGGLGIGAFWFYRKNRDRLSTQERDYMIYGNLVENGKFTRDAR